MTGATHGIVYFMVPDGIDDDQRISGGNVYDRHVRDELGDQGWDVRILVAFTDRLGEASIALSNLPDDTLVLIDGLIASALSPIAIGQSVRLRIVVLAHIVSSVPTGPGHAEPEATERRALAAARRVIATSQWTRSELIAGDFAEPERVVVAYPGTDSAPPLSSGSASGTRLLCVGVVAPHKGQDVLLEALTALGGAFDWTCSFVGSLTAAPGYAAELSARIHKAGLANRIRLTGVLTGTPLEDAYNAADLLIAPSRTESYGMAVTEALARGIPVVATRVGGLPEAIAGNPAGILVPPDDPWAMGVVIRRWAGDLEWRGALRAEARRSRSLTRHWGETAAVVSSTLSDVARGESIRLVAANAERSGRGVAG
jgi:glycosyltransferase involved in cell wall biosynthesis